MIIKRLSLALCLILGMTSWPVFDPNFWRPFRPKNSTLEPC